LREPAELSEYAAEAASRILRENWTDALSVQHPGFDSASMARDLDQTIEHLRRWKALLLSEKGLR
jgi:hypothetical protein